MLQRFKTYLQLVLMPRLRKPNFLIFFSSYLNWYIYNYIVWYQVINYDNTLPIYVKTNTYNTNDVILYNYRKFIVLQQATNIDITNTDYFIQILDNNIGATILKNIAPNGAQLEFILNLNFKGTYVSIYDTSNSIYIVKNNVTYFGYIGDTLPNGCEVGDTNGFLIGSDFNINRNVFTINVKNYTNKPNENTIRNFVKKIVPLNTIYNIIFLT